VHALTDEARTVWHIWQRFLSLGIQVVFVEKYLSGTLRENAVDLEEKSGKMSFIHPV